MLLSENWKDYELIDVSMGERLERWGKYTLIRPDPQVIWRTERKNPLWKRFDARYHRSDKGGGSWEFISLPKEWSIGYRLKPSLSSPAFSDSPISHTSYSFPTTTYSLLDPLKGESKERGREERGSEAGEAGEAGDEKQLRFNLKPFSFKHTGLFPEQAANWDYIYKSVRHECLKRKRNGDERAVTALNLFAYTGASTLALSSAGASVVHVDSSRGMVNWARENAIKSGLENAPIRWIVDDCQKFVEREIRRNRYYDAVVLDPPSYGRGPKGEIWKMEDMIYSFLLSLSKLLLPTSLFLILNSYTTGLQPATMKYLLSSVLLPRLGGEVVSDELGLRVTENGLIHPCGAVSIWRNTQV